MTKYATIEALVEAHVQDIIESAGTDEVSFCADVALATLLAVMMTAHGGDAEKVMADLDLMERHVRRGFDSGELRFAAYS